MELAEKTAADLKYLLVFPLNRLFGGFGLSGTAMRALRSAIAPDLNGQIQRYYCVDCKNITQAK